MKVKANWNSGNFTLLHESDVDAAQFEILANLGLLHVMQRNAEHDRVLGIVVKVGDKWKRKEGLTRAMVDFSQELASRLAASTGYGEAEIADGVKIDILTDVVAYERTAPELKFKREKDIVKSKNGDATRLGATAEKVGFEFEEETELTVENEAFLKAIKAFLDKAAKEV